MYKILSFFIVFGSCSCHFYDDRIVLINKSDQKLLFAVCNIQPNKRTDMLSPFYRIEPKSKRSLSLFKDLNYNSLSADSIAVIKITPQAEDSIKWESGYNEYEKLFSEGRFNYRNYSVADVIDDDRLIAINPEDGFKDAR